MNRLARLIIGFIIIGWVAQCQQSNTVFQGAMVTNGAISPFISNPVRNIGQAGHEFHIRYTNAPAMVCAAPTSTAFAQGSYDLTNWFNFGVGSLAQYPSNAMTVNLPAQGAYPYVRVSITFDNVNCRLQLDYSGVLVQPPVTTVQGLYPNVPITAFEDGRNVNPIIIGGLGTGSINNAFTTSLAICRNNAYTSVASGAVGPVVPLVTITVPATMHMRLCSMFLRGDNAGTTVFLFEDTGTNPPCTGSSAQLTPIIPIGTGYIAMPGGVSPLFTTGTPGHHICMNVAGAGNAGISTAFAMW